MNTPSVKEADRAKKEGKLIGTGAYRKVYRPGDSPWVYKFNNYAGTRSGNREEYTRYLRLKSKFPKKNIYLPEMQIFDNGVLAAQYIEGKHPFATCYPFIHECKNEKSCFWTYYDFVEDIIGDAHSENVIVTKSGHVYLIDLAS